MVLPNIFQYRYNSATGRYINSQGRFVTTEEINRIINARIDEGKDRLFGFYQLALDQNSNFSFDDMRESFALELRNLHVQMAIVGAGGRDQMTFSLYGSVGRTLRDEYGYMNNFITEIEAGNISDGQIRSRINMYMNKAYNAHWKTKTNKAQIAGFTEEKRVLNPAEHCNDCISLAARGWQPIGTLPEPADGSTECLSNCKCTKVYR